MAIGGVTMSKYPDLSEADRIIMNILWRDGTATSAVILSEIEDSLGWSRQTVRTYLKRLMDKGLVNSREERKRVYSYYPVVSKKEYADDKAGSCFNRYYESLSHMVAGIVKNEDISDSDLDELEALIKQLRSKEGK